MKKPWASEHREEPGREPSPASGLQGKGREGAGVLPEPGRTLKWESQPGVAAAEGPAGARSEFPPSELLLRSPLTAPIQGAEDVGAWGVRLWKWLPPRVQSRAAKREWSQQEP